MTDPWYDWNATGATTTGQWFQVVHQPTNAGTLWYDFQPRTRGNYVRYVAPPPLTPAQAEEARRVQEERVREHRARVTAEAARMRLASERARTFLLEHLDEVQLEEYEVASLFHVVGSTSGRRYCIKKGREHNVFQLDPETDRPILELCGHVRDDIPDEDNLLLQKFMLETDEAEFLRIANARSVRVG